MIIGQFRTSPVEQDEGAAPNVPGTTMSTLSSLLAQRKRRGAARSEAIARAISAETPGQAGTEARPGAVRSGVGVVWPSREDLLNEARALEVLPPAGPVAPPEAPIAAAKPFPTRAGPGHASPSDDEATVAQPVALAQSSQTPAQAPQEHLKPISSSLPPPLPKAEAETETETDVMGLMFRRFFADLDDIKRSLGLRAPASPSDRFAMRPGEPTDA